MSDLDADLYGGKQFLVVAAVFVLTFAFVLDLYGNDESEFAVPTTHADEPAVKTESSEKQEVKREASPSPPPPASAPASATNAESSKSAQAASTLNEATPQAYAPAPQSQVPVYTSPTTQQIPTYQERQDVDYSDMAPQRADSGYPPLDRPVRPSEMKEEGVSLSEGLRKYFTQFGKVEACTIMRDAAGRSRCFAFLTFEDPQSVNAVMVREHFLDGKIIDPKRAIPRQEHQRATKLFIGGLAGTVTSESMREFFSQFGKVVDSTVMLDRETGRSKGFGFVSFEGANVEPILGFGNLEIDGKMIDVKLAQPRSQRENFAENGGTVAPTGTGMGRGQFNNNQFGGQNAYAGNIAATGQTPTAGNAPFDPQALASLYTRMFQQMGGMNPMMGGGMGMSGGMMGGGMYNGGMGAGMRMPGMGANPMAGAGMMGMGGMGGAAGMGGMGRGAGMGGNAAAGGMVGGNLNPGMNVPRGPRGAPTGPGGGAGIGPQRAGQRGQHNYHPYAR
ncbi:hypothetical protein EUX98_g7692 [Antrodiella citrinella]|uniref:RRM domain-containing protein n=1 Tax=Antrodiella citrinella TaxID=2447956 RepID=A0A4S4MLF8_9APHY|nr:hypothetical protein EUX98_g7692 [Antrodiella citrinella]